MLIINSTSFTTTSGSYEHSDTGRDIPPRDNARYNRSSTISIQALKHLWISRHFRKEIHPQTMFSSTAKNSISKLNKILTLGSDALVNTKLPGTIHFRVLFHTISSSIIRGWCTLRFQVNIRRYTSFQKREVLRRSQLYISLIMPPLRPGTLLFLVNNIIYAWG